jgi:MFS family permease
MMLLDMLIIVTGAVISALATDATMLIAGQLLVGIGVGIDFPVSASYVAEWMPRQIRSRMMVATIACQSVGFIVAAALSLLLVSISHSPALWRWFFFGEAATAALFLLMRSGLPESARWLASIGRMAEARAALARVVAAAPDAGLAAAASTPMQGEAPGYGVLFSRAYRKRTALAALPWFLMDIATYGVGLFTPVILAAIHFGKTASGAIAAESVDIKGSGSIDLFLLIGFAIGLFVVPRFGRVQDAGHRPSADGGGDGHPLRGRADAGGQLDEDGVDLRGFRPVQPGDECRPELDDLRHGLRALSHHAQGERQWPGGGGRQARRDAQRLPVADHQGRLGRPRRAGPDGGGVAPRGGQHRDPQ